MIKIEATLYDAHEMNGFANFWSQLQAYRAEKYPEYPGAEPTPSTPEPVVELNPTMDTRRAEEIAERIADDTRHAAIMAAGKQVVDAAIVGSIAPSSSLEDPGEEKLMEAAQAYAKSNGLDKALKVIREVGGVARVGEVPADKRAAVFAVFTQ